MRTIAQPAGVLATLAVLTFAASPASATVLYVSETGSDANNCFSSAQACRSIGKAETQASDGDVIQIISGGNFFSAFVTKTVTILSTQGPTIFGGEAPCLTINGGATTVVNVDGVNCVPSPDGSDGILFNRGEKLRLRNLFIRGGIEGSCGVNFQPSNHAELFIENSIISENGTTGAGGAVCVVPQSGAHISGVLDRVTAQNSRFGLRTSAGGAARIDLLVQGSVFAADVVGIRSTGANSVLRISNSSIYKNNAGLQSTVGGSLISIGGNVLADNGVNGAFTSTEAKQ